MALVGSFYKLSHDRLQVQGWHLAPGEEGRKLGGGGDGPCALRFVLMAGVGLAL